MADAGRPIMGTRLAIERPSDRRNGHEGSCLTLSLDIRRIGLTVLSLLIALAVVGPACLMVATEAFAMSAHTEAPMNGCDDSGSSMSACPHEDGVETTVATQDNVPIVQTVMSSGPVEPASIGFARTALTEQPPSAPVAHLIPLRL